MLFCSRRAVLLKTIDTRTDSLGRLTVRKVLHELKDTHQHQAPRSVSRLAETRVQSLEIVISEYLGEMVTNRHDGVIAFGKGRVGYAKGVFWNGLNRVRMEGHVLFSQVISYNSTPTDFANRVR